MIYDKKLIEAIRRRAYGFYYDEENVEYESKGGGRYLLCKKQNRVYVGSGFVKVKIKKMFSASVRVVFKKLKSFVAPSGKTRQVFALKNKNAKP